MSGASTDATAGRTPGLTAGLASRVPGLPPGLASGLRLPVTAGLLALALVLQVSFLPAVMPHWLGQGVVPNLCLLVVVAAALVRGPERAAVLGFVAGLLLDLTPPADHVAGRWALALVVVGYVVGRVSAGQSSRPTATGVMVTVAGASFVGTSVYAISGLLLRDPVVPVTDLLPVILLAVVCDVLLTPVVLPGLMRMLVALEPGRQVRA